MPRCSTSQYPNMSTKIHQPLSTYDVLYNPCYGRYGLQFPDDFVKEVFRQYPPESEEGNPLWKPYSDTNPIVKTEDFCHGYQWVYYKNWSNTDIYTDSCTKDFKTYYTVKNTQEDIWRTWPVLIEMAKDWDLLDKCLHIKKIPMAYDFQISEYDGQESVKAVCPKDRIIEDLLRVLKTGDRESKSLHTLTRSLLLETYSYEEILTPPRVE